MGVQKIERYCTVLEGSIHDGTLLHSKIQHTTRNYNQKRSEHNGCDQTLQVPEHNSTVKHSQQLFGHTYTSNLYDLGTLTHSSNQQESVAKYTRTSWLARFQNPTDDISRSP
jgi:hypothetical protein